ncbi:MAG: hypothetical protein HN712_20180 [Gemmatimonadetes bacterium]|jgi:hypothetical protein|nr:hypothetical protein [Gemmatimonadota bacterium]MBT6147782.1 hypothetical protein [Gemmatimonadota bacterium]MBT7862644.1 hypothetical protein [Gemmatimonadota bacterium]
MSRAGWMQAVTLPAVLMLLVITAAADDDDDDPAAKATEARQQERAPGPGREVRDALREAGLDPSDPEARSMRRVLLEEGKLRRRLARIGRLRELAAGNEERLAALDRLEARTRDQHERKVDRALERVERGKKKKLKEHLERGRGRAGHGRSGGMDDAEDGRKPETVGRPEGRGKPQNTDRPKRNAAEGGARGAKKGNQ